MDELVTSFVNLFGQYGLAITLISLAGVIVLGILKYCNVFKKVDEKYRHYAYLGISIALSMIGSVIYLACVHQLTFSIFCALASIIFGINQAAYAIYANTPLKELLLKLLDIIKNLIHKSDKVDDTVKDVADKAVDAIKDSIDKKEDK